MLCFLVNCININQKSDFSLTLIYHAMCLNILFQYQSEEWYVCHSDLSPYVSEYTVSVSLRRVIFLSQWFIMLCLLVYCISINQKSGMSVKLIYHPMSLSILYQWFITLCLLIYCINITKKRDISVMVIYHAMTLSILYQYLSEEWYFCNSDMSCYVS